MRTLNYILPKSNYFNQGERGRVTHAIGIAEGFSKNNWKVNVISGKGLKKFRSRLPENVNLIEVCHQKNKKNKEKKWRKKILDLFQAHLEPSSILIIRYTISIPFFTYKVAKLTKRKGNILTIIEVNSLAFHNLRRIPYYLRWLLSKFERFVITKYDIIYVVSNSLKEDMIKLGFRSKIIVVLNASSIRTEKLKIESGKKIIKSRFLYLGIMQSYYDFKMLIKAFKFHSRKYPSFSLHLYGYGNMEKDIKQYVNNDEKIFFHGKYRNEDITKIVNFDTDVLVLPYKKNSLANIGSPMKLFEYMSLGLPVLASNVGQLNDIIIDKHNGYLYDSANINSLIDKMEYIAQNSLSSRNVGQQGLKELLSKHTWEVRIKSMINNLDKIRRNGCE